MKDSQHGRIIENSSEAAAQGSRLDDASVDPQMDQLKRTPTIISAALVMRESIGVSVRRLSVIASGHYLSAERFEKRNNYFTTIIITMITMLLFVSNLDSIFSEYKWAVGLVSAFAVAMAAIQYALKDQELINQHKTSGVNFSAIRRDLEQLLVLDDQQLLQQRDQLPRLLEKYTLISSHSPIIHRRNLKEAKRYISCHEKDQADFFAKIASNSINGSSTPFLVP